MYLLDTSVISEYIRKKPSKKVIDWLDEQNEDSLYISCLTIAELKKGYYKLQGKMGSEAENNENNKNNKNNKRVEQLGSWIHQLEDRFQGRIIPIDSEMLESWALTCGYSEAEGRKLPVLDSLLVATAQTHGMTAVTRNVSDFRNCSTALKIHNPY